MNNKLIHRGLVILIILLGVIPIVFICKLNMITHQEGVPLQTLLENNIMIVIQMLSVFLLPLMALCLYGKLAEYKENPNDMYYILTILALSNFVMRNVSYGLIMFAISLFIMQVNKINLLKKENLRYFSFTERKKEWILVLIAIGIRLLQNKMLR